MGRKRKRAWRQVDTSAEEKHVAQKNIESADQALASANLFYTDTEGNVNSTANRKKRAQEAIASRLVDTTMTLPKRKLNPFKQKQQKNSTTVISRSVKKEISDIWDAAPPQVSRQQAQHRPSKHVTQLKKSMTDHLSINPDAKLQQESVQIALQEDARLKEERRQRELRMSGEHPDFQFDNILERLHQVEGKAPQQDYSHLNPKQRRRLERERRRRREEKQVENDLNNLPRIVKELKKREQEGKQAQEDRKANPRDQTTRKLSKHGRISDTEFPEFLLTEEVEESQGQLRKAPNSLSVVEDQFKRFMKRNLLEPRKKQAVTEARLRSKKMVFRNSFKADTDLFPKGVW